MDLKRRLRPLLVRYRHRGIREADVFLASYPRSGSTWLRFMMYEVLTRRPADFDVVNHAIPYVGGHHRAPGLLTDGGRVIKTHELYRASSYRTVYLVRDVRAVLPSMYTQQRRVGYPGTFESFVQRFVSGDVGPFGTWAQHVTFWTADQATVDEHVLVIRFEDLREDPTTTLRRILLFLGIVPSDRTLATAVRNNDLRAMREKERATSGAAIVNRREDLPFVGSGASEGWRDLDADHVARVEAMAASALERFGYPLTTSAGDDA